MGLDMYLIREVFIGNNYKDRNSEQFTLLPPVENPEFKDVIDSSKITSITENVIYWRKANAIHNWFVNQVQDGKDDCERHCVEKEKLEQLLLEIEQDLEALKEENITGNLNLEPTSGFFFGSTDIDEYYIEELKRTAKSLKELVERDKKISNLLKGKGVYTDYYYEASW